jgi:hypothetical protein
MMPTLPPPTRRPPPSWLQTLTALGLCALAMAPALAQYKVTGPDGRVTYTDRPPQTPQVRVEPLAIRGGSVISTAGMPYELSQAVKRFPVTFFTLANDCQVCDNARQHLRSRGIPFQERSISSPEDTQAFKKTTGGLDLPALRTGEKLLHGFNASAWDQQLDTAGYPKQSRLPTQYAQPAPQPMAEPKPADPPAAPAAPRPAPSLEPTPGAGGIRF